MGRSVANKALAFLSFLFLCFLVPIKLTWFPQRWIEWTQALEPPTAFPTFFWPEFSDGSELGRAMSQGVGGRATRNRRAAQVASDPPASSTTGQTEKQKEVLTIRHKSDQENLQ